MTDKVLKTLEQTSYQSANTVGALSEAAAGTLDVSSRLKSMW
jgi:hypothetical protein